MDGSYKRYSLIFHFIILFILLNISYIIIQEHFNYLPHGFYLDIEPIKIIVSILMFFFFMYIGIKIKNDFVYFIYISSLFYFFCSELINWCYNSDTNANMLILYVGLMISIRCVDRVKLRVPVIKNISYKRNILIFVSFLLFLPFIYFYFNKIDIRNLLLIDIYETRSEFREISNAFTGYIIKPLVSIILPYLIIDSIEKKKKIQIVIFSLMIIYVFLCGALKSILFSLILTFILFKYNWRYKINLLIRCVNYLLIIALIVYVVFDNYFIFNFVRRVVFTPARLNTIYINHFFDSPTLYSHSPLGLGLVENRFGSLSIYVGEFLLGAKGLNANVGIMVEGMVSLKWIGGIIILLFIVSFVILLKSINFSEKYAGMLIFYIYYINTSFLSILLLTHGFFFFLIFSFVFLRND